MAALMGSKLATPFAGGRRVEFKRQMEECQGVSRFKDKIICI